MAIPRFYVPGPWNGSQIPFPEKASHHAMIVLRMRAGDRAEIFDGEGNSAFGTLEFSKTGTVMNVETVKSESAESPLGITLVQSFVSPEKLEWIVEKTVEAGVRRIILCPAARSVTRLAGDKLEKRLAKLRITVSAACEQCGRSRVPALLSAPNLETALKLAEADCRVILAPGATDGIRLGSAKSVSFAVGPEGGFSEEELSLAESLGWSRGLLGPRVLRTETAGLVAVSCANAVCGDYEISGERIQ